VAAFEGLAPVDECELRLRQLRSFVVRAGHDWTERAKLMLDALADRLNAQIAAGAEPPTDPSAWIKPAGMTLEERIVLAKSLLSAMPPRGDVVVWLAYANATIERSYLSKGPLEFYDWRIWPAALEGEWPGNRNWQQPAELAHPDASGRFDGLPKKDFVVVRVALTDVPTTEAADRARELVDAALALTGWEAEWVALRGATAVAAHWFGTMGFVDPRTVSPWSTPLLDPVTSELAGVDDDLLERLSAGDQAAKELVDDVHWRRNASAAPSRDHRVALAVTLIERILPPTSPAGGAWYDVTSYYLKTLLALDELSGRVSDAGETTVHGRISGHRDEPFVHANEIVEHHGRNAFRVHQDRVVARIDELVAYAEPGTMEARMLAEVKTRMTDGPTALAWLVECEVRFECLLARARRQRNSITHGTRTVADIVSSVEPFLDRIAGRLVGALQASVEEKTHLPTQLASYKTWWDKQKAALAAGGDPAAELFPPS
jgi:hypothetical protein